MTRAELIAQVKVRQELEQRKIDARCQRDMMYWLHNCTNSYDPKAMALGMNPVRPFPKWKYFDVMAYFLTRPAEYPRIFIPKSREMLSSWLVAAYATFLAQWTPYAQVICQTEQESKATKLVGYSKCLYDQQAEWQRKMHPLKGGYFKTRPGKDKELELKFANGAEIIGIASGANQIPSYHPSLAVLDEAALWPEAALSYQLALPVAAQIICVSTARPGWFQDECEATPGVSGEPDNIDDRATLALRERMHGVDFGAQGMQGVLAR
jgi:hypothetical protein